MSNLTVCFEDQIVGNLSRDLDGSMFFNYSTHWLRSKTSFPLSLILKLRREPYRGQEALSFFENLLPEADVRHRIERFSGISSGNDFEFLRRFGEDCAGAITIHSFPPSQTDTLKKRKKKQTQIEITPQNVRKVIENDEPLQLAMGLSEEELPRFSLAGAQNKFPCVFDGKRIFLPTEGSPTTHIVKLPIRVGEKLLDSVFNEFVAMQLANACGLPVPSTQVIGSNYPVFIIQRFDRENNGTKWSRIHCQDFCQALGISGKNKYASHGGPELKECYQVIAENSYQPSSDLLAFIDWIAFNLAIGNNDSHAKNISLLLTRHGLRLAPFYDLVATALYPQFSTQFAFPIGGITRWERIRSNHLEILAMELGIKFNFLKSRWLQLFFNLRSVDDSIFEQSKKIPQVGITYRKLRNVIKKRINHLEKYALK